MNRLRTYATRYHFNLALKISITILLSLWFFLLCLDTSSGYHGSYLQLSDETGYIYDSSESSKSASIADISHFMWTDFFQNSSSFPEIFPYILVIIVSVALITFIWLNRPGESLVCSALTLMITCFLDIRLFGYNSKWNTDCYIAGWHYTSDYDIFYNSTTYTLAWLMIILIMGVSITTVALSLSHKKQSAVPTHSQPQQPIVQLASSPVASLTSPYEQLRQYKQLMDEGVITEAEFEQKKRDLLK